MSPAVSRRGSPGLHSPTARPRPLGPEPSVTFSEELRFSSLPFARFAAAVIDAHLPHVASARWSTDTGGLDAVEGDVRASSRDRHAECVFFARGDGLAYVHLSYGSVFARFAAGAQTELVELEQLVRSWLPESAPSDDQLVPVTFWSRCGHTGDQFSRCIRVSSWQQIAANYPASARDAMTQLTAQTGWEETEGRLLLWHGPPGTGKTHALRALAWAWREWCDLHYVTDPEELFGSSSYLLSVLLDAVDQTEEHERWRLMVLEDTGELLSADAKERTGQGLSRLLNVVDGLIGQSLPVLVLVTTNERLRTLHRAVARPGRCACELEFASFAAADADAWLADRGRPPIGRQATLAELFAGGARGVRSSRSRVGFAG